MVEESDGEELSMYVIYDHPSDFPHHFAVRQAHITRTGNRWHTIAGLYSSLEEARAGIPAHCVCLQRDEMDDPVIVETWL